MEVVSFNLTTDIRTVVFRTAVRTVRMMSRVLRLGQGSRAEKTMLRTRITRVTVSLSMFNLLQEVEERNIFLWLMILSRWSGRARARTARGTETAMMFQAQSSTFTGPSVQREELWQPHSSNITSGNF